MEMFLVIAAAIALQIFLTARGLSPFLSLLLVAIGMGLALGMSPQDLLKTIEEYRARNIAAQQDAQSPQHSDAA